MAWLKFISLVLQLLVIVGAYLGSRRAISSAEAEIALRLLQETQDAIAKSQDARRAVRDELKRSPERLRDDDGFRRD